MTPPHAKLQPGKKISPAFKDISKVSSKKEKQKQHTDHLACHLTSEKFVELCEEKKKNEKEKRLVREENSRKRKEDAEEKARIREQKQEE